MKVNRLFIADNKYLWDNFFKPKERYESETNTEVLSMDEIIPKNQDAVRAPSFFTAVPPLFNPLNTTVSDTVNEPEPAQEIPSEPQSTEVMVASEDSFVEATPLPTEEHEPITEIIAEYVAETNGVEETIGNFESNQEFLHEEIPEAQTEEVTEHVFDIDD
ncbi:hypothetical protein RR48_03586 [Papilio machaon]|uniref:Uncharacterized protein n=1 Tax=Papilio machaon TaxID=76193 RepID=A0A0N1PG69_PAPMA|nr:hypothetical protein RR48_03586 [Papilio machaon]